MNCAPPSLKSLFRNGRLTNWEMRCLALGSYDWIGCPACGACDYPIRGISHSYHVAALYVRRVQFESHTSFSHPDTHTHTEYTPAPLLISTTYSLLTQSLENPVGGVSAPNPVCRTPPPSFDILLSRFHPHMISVAATATITET